jgi:chemotaxis protein histidine kinase CheA
MDSLLSPLTDQRHKDDIAKLVSGPSATKARPGKPTHDPHSWHVASGMTPEPIDASAEETCPAPTGPQVPAHEEAPELAPAIEVAQAPSATTFELMNQLEALARDLAVKERPSSHELVEKTPDQDKEDASDGQRQTENAPEVSDFSPALTTTEPTIHVPARSTSFEDDQFAAEPWVGKRTILTLVMAGLLGVGVAFAWQSYSGWTAKSPGSDVTADAVQTKSAPLDAAPASNAALPQAAPTASARVPAASPELAKQLEAMKQDLAAARQSVEQLASTQQQLSAKQDQLAATQQRLEQLAAKQEQLAVKQDQLAAKQDQIAQNIAKLQALEQNTRHKVPAPPQRAASVPTRVTPEPPAPPPPAPRAPSHPVPPLPVPQ